MQLPDRTAIVGCRLGSVKMPAYMSAQDVFDHFGGKLSRSSCYSLMRRIGTVPGIGKPLVLAEAFHAYIAPKQPDAVRHPAARRRQAGSMAPAGGFRFLPPA
jgi:hypothetical protein